MPFGNRINFIHLSSTKSNVFGDFYEDNHLDADVAIYAVIKEIVKATQEEIFLFLFAPTLYQHVII